jgi:3-hydroxyacyl-[acyl-carrier-protein] dehydratase
VVPGDQIEIEINVTKARGAMGWVSGVARVDGKTVSEADISFALVDGEVTDL